MRVRRGKSALSSRRGSACDRFFRRSNFFPERQGSRLPKYRTNPESTATAVVLGSRAGPASTWASRWIFDGPREVSAVDAFLHYVHQVNYVRGGPYRADPDTVHATTWGRSWVLIGQQDGRKYKDCLDIKMKTNRSIYFRPGWYAPPSTAQGRGGSETAEQSHGIITADFTPVNRIFLLCRCVSRSPLFFSFFPLIYCVACFFFFFPYLFFSSLSLSLFILPSVFPLSCFCFHVARLVLFFFHALFVCFFFLILVAVFIMFCLVVCCLFFPVLFLFLVFFLPKQTHALFLYTQTGINPVRTAVPFRGQTILKIEWFVPKTGLRFLTGLNTLLGLQSRFGDKPLLRGAIVNRTYDKHKNVYIHKLLLTIFGPINYGPPSQT